jgi:hypothetical protein
LQVGSHFNKNVLNYIDGKHCVYLTLNEENKEDVNNLPLWKNILEE